MNTAYFKFLGFLLFAFTSNGQQLYINEVSQGPSGAKEYVEFVVSGLPTCQTPVPTLDLRGVVIDDNNGYFAAGSGTGIASGAVRFATSTFWSAIPQGTIILIYNNSDINALIPPDDVSMTDNNCRLVLPANSVLLEGQSTSPTTSVSTYPLTVNWIAGGGSWSQLGMSNSNDSFQIRSSITATAATHAISWGNNTQNNQIYFSTIGGGVFALMNTTNNLPSLQANWTVGSVETPGAANNTANATWIASMNPQCGIAPSSIQLTLTPTAISCLGGATGSISSSVNGGTAPYTYLWNNNALSSSLTNITAGTYTLTVTDALGCTATQQVTLASNSGLTVTPSATNASCSASCDGFLGSNVVGGTAPYAYLWSTTDITSSIQNVCPGTYIIAVSDANGCTDTAHVIVNFNVVVSPTITLAGPFLATSTASQLTASPIGGTWSSDCGNCLTANGLFSPTIAGVGLHQICYATGIAPCDAIICITIIVNAGCLPTDTSFQVSLCPDSTYTINGQTLSTPGTTSLLGTNIDGCDSTITVTLTNFAVNPLSVQLAICPGGSVSYWGYTFVQASQVFIDTLTSEGCPVTHTLTITEQQCDTVEFSLFAPNTFTPNNDQTNDVFEILLTGAQLEDGFILNRWGEVIKPFSPIDLKWDGLTENGVKVSDGVYTWVIYYTPVNGNRQSAHGFITVLQ